MAGDSIPIKRKLGYSVGHAFNDLTASMWYTYLIAYFHEVKNFNDTLAGTLMMIGQSVDAVLTPLVGLASDNSKSGCFNIGRRKSWHLIGTCSSFRIKYFLNFDFNTSSIFFSPIPSTCLRYNLQLPWVSVHLYTLLVLRWSSRLGTIHILRTSDCYIPIWVGVCANWSFSSDS